MYTNKVNLFIITLKNEPFEKMYTNYCTKMQKVINANLCSYQKHAYTVSIHIMSFFLPKSVISMFILKFNCIQVSVK